MEMIRRFGARVTFLPGWEIPAMIRWLAIGWLALVAVHPAWGQSWAVKMFAVRQHNFGTVARGAKAEYAFEFENLYKETIHVAGVRVSCGCTSARVTKATVPSLERSSILATFNTRSFVGQRGATITVIIDQPYYAEVQLRVDGYIRSDVVFDPGEVDFGSVGAGESAERHIRVAYAGRSSWTIQDVRSANEHLEVELSEPQRSPGRVTYDMTVRLKPTAPVGFFQDQLVLVTDDRYQDQVTLAVEGRIVSALTVANDLVLGTVRQGETVTRNLVVRGRQPFRITGIECDDDRFECSADSESKRLHVVKVKFQAGKEPGDFRNIITVETDLPGEHKCQTVVTGTVR